MKKRIQRRKGMIGLVELMEMGKKKKGTKENPGEEEVEAWVVAEVVAEVVENEVLVDLVLEDQVQVDLMERKWN